MSATTASALSEFVDTYHLWFFILLLCLLGVYHFLDLVVYLCFKFLGGINESYYNYKTHCVENRRRHEKLAGESVSVASSLSHRAGAD
jgi:hypothetical protein